MPRDDYDDDYGDDVKMAVPMMMILKSDTHYSEENIKLNNQYCLRLHYLYLLSKQPDFSAQLATNQS